MDCSASASLYPAVEGAFGTAGGSGDVGQCPAPAGGLDCAGAVSNCWSPGQRDTDCPNNGLCWSELLEQCFMFTDRPIMFQF